MTPQIMQMLLLYIVYMLAFKELIFAAGQDTKEMIEQGRIQYQLLKERSYLPRYGTCWKTAVEHVDEGCKRLSEETQGDIALHLTNCFLEMSGHETYNCELDKKPNLRAICISSMSDRAFSVYTVFYTHTQNICWFLRGHVWQESIYENTWKVGKQLELTVSYQEGLLRTQKESLELQEKMLKHGKNLEQVLDSLHESSNSHKNILMMLSKSINNLQSWIIGEVSWIDSVVFYMVSVFVTFLLTSSQRTLSSRVPISILLFFNLLLERMICSFITSDSTELNILNLYLRIYDFVWYSRYGFVCLAAVTFLYKSVYHTDIHFKNNEILHKIHSQNTSVLKALNFLKYKLTSETNGVLENKSFITEESEFENSSSFGCDIPIGVHLKKYYLSSDTTKQSKFRKDLDDSLNNPCSNTNIRIGYNLRSNSRQATPDC